MGILDSDINFSILGNNKRKNIRWPVSKSQKNEVFARQKNKCNRCKKLLDMRAVHFDHIKEVYRGGKSIIDNLQALCANCHNIKTHEERLKKVERRRQPKKITKNYDLISKIDMPKFNNKDFRF